MSAIVMEHFSTSEDPTVDTQSGEVRSIHECRHTTVDGIEVSWRVVDHAVRVQSIGEVAGRTLMSYRGPDYPNLGQAEELWPRLSALWNAVRGELRLMNPEETSQEPPAPGHAGPVETSPGEGISNSTIRRPTGGGVK
ncbi:hypothetical protein J2W56_006629 [Nocardia kruczakiae]|uniref:Uncharacterized protein n=1 Tax=Nocardia kruczakiae TaxID=261477 RepID=A0ABU1XQM0_9NOCA|nr:hypothetical protein [Nocardia kruczakiae]MDR7172863.1 hypothetical protein [Nocardia kruczakiae]